MIVVKKNIFFDSIRKVVFIKNFEYDETIKIEISKYNVNFVEMIIIINVKIDQKRLSQNKLMIRLAVE